MARTRDILRNYWNEQKLAEDENIEVVQSLKVLNSVFQDIMESQKNKEKKWFSLGNGYWLIDSLIE